MIPPGELKKDRKARLALGPDALAPSRGDAAIMKASGSAMSCARGRASSSPICSNEDTDQKPSHVRGAGSIASRSTTCVPPAA